jgi:hypothetical protein
MQESFEMLLDFFKVVGNESRLKIVGILANREHTMSELAAILDLKESTVLQHVSLLQESGLVTMREDGKQRRYSFNVQRLHDMNKELYSHEDLATTQSFEEVGDAWERKVLNTYFEGDRLVEFPVSNKNWDVVNKWLAGHFEYGVQYSEKQVNEILTRFHADYATLRRELVDSGYMQRAKGIYWRVENKTTVVEA